MRSLLDELEMDAQAAAHIADTFEPEPESEKVYYDRHPLSEVWGDMSDDEKRELVESVRAHQGLLDPVIWKHDERILDGWHRYQVANLLEVSYELREYEGDDPVGFVIARNAHRRHLTAGQRAACVVACHEWAGRGQPKKSEPGSSFSIPATEQQMADAAGTSTKTIQQAKIAQDAGLSEKTRSGELSPKAAAEMARGEPDKPKPLTPTELLEAERDALRLDAQEKARQIEDLAREVQFLRDQPSPVEATRERTFNDMRAEIRILEAARNRYMNESSANLRSSQYWEREAKKACPSCGAVWERRT